jgi:PKD repeat protein
MNYTNRKMIALGVIFAAALGFTAMAAGASYITDVSIDAPSTAGVDEEFTISGSAEGSELTEIKVRRKIGSSSWYVISENDCAGAYCPITASTSHGYEGDEVYQVKAYADGVTEDTSQTVTFEEGNQPPTADFKYTPHNPSSGETVSFDAYCYTGSPCATDPDGSVTAYMWDLDGDGVYGDKTGASVTKSFSDTTEVGLRVRDDDGAYDTERKTVQVSGVDRDLSVMLFQPVDGKKDVGTDPRFTFQGAYGDRDGAEEVKFILHLDRGRSNNPFQAPDRTKSITIPDDKRGSIKLDYDLDQDTWYSWGVTVRHDGESKNSDWRNFKTGYDEDTDYGDDPDASFTYYPDSPEEGEQVSFDGSESSDPDGYIVDYDWDFGDGYSASGSDVTHSFDDSGSYPVELTVEDEDGNTGTKTRYIHVDDYHRPDPPEYECGVTEDSIDYRLKDYAIHRGDSTEAVVDISNTASQDQDVEVKFKVNQNVVEVRDVTVSGGNSRRVTHSVSPDEDSFIRAVVNTEGEPCGSQQYRFNRELIVYYGDEEESFLDVKVTDEGDDPIKNARIEVDGPEDSIRYTDDWGKTGFSLKSGSYDVQVSHPDYDTEEKNVHLSEGENEQLEFELNEDEGGEGTLRITVKDGEGDWIEDAEVEVDGPEHETEYTDDYGFASFDLEEGSYDVQVSHSDYEDTADRTVYVEEGETTTRTLRLYDEERDGIQITQVNYPSSVCRGATLSADVTVENNAERDEWVTVTGSGLGSINVLEGFALEEGEQKTRTVRFTNVQGSGEEEFRIVARNGTDDSTDRAVDVRNCGVPESDQEAKDISMKLSYPVSPNRALVGDTVKVSGFVDGVTGRTDVEINVAGGREASVSTQPDGYYQTFIRMDSPGTKTVTARTTGAATSRDIEVLPTATVSTLTAPRKVFEGETFEVCSEINSQIQAGVFLYEDGKLLKKVNANGGKCFQVTAQQPGMHTYTVRAATPGESSSSTVSVQVLETDVEVSSFPSQIASVESASGMVRVELYNTHSEQKRYNLELEGLPSTWISQSEKEVVLGMGERRTVYFYLTPREEGTYEPMVSVEADGEKIYRQKVDLVTGGQARDKQQGFLERLGELFKL